MKTAPAPIALVPTVSVTKGPMSVRSYTFRAPAGLPPGHHDIAPTGGAGQPAAASSPPPIAQSRPPRPVAPAPSKHEAAFLKLVDAMSDPAGAYQKGYAAGLAKGIEVAQNDPRVALKMARAISRGWFPKVKR